MKSIVKTVVFALCMGVVFSGLGLISASPSYAAPKIIKIEGAGLSVEKTMAENIANFKGKTITVTLTSGESITGKVVDVNSKFLHLGELERTNFFDAFIDMSKISAFKAQVRKYAND